MAKGQKRLKSYAKRYPSDGAGKTVKNSFGVCKRILFVPIAEC
nr:D153 [uncultured bacterium]